jgi:spermidine synthase
MTALLCSIFFASGASALIFETLWFRQAGLAFGNSVWASSLVLSGFMGGLALGNALAARHGDRIRNPVRVYAFAELTIALTGIGLVYVFPVLGAALAPWLRPLLDHPWILNPLRLFIAFLLLLIPSTAMGITLPLLSKALMTHDSNFGSVLGRLYGWNTLGAVAGVVIGEAFLLGVLGVRGTAVATGGLNILAAAAAGWLSMQTTDQSFWGVGASEDRIRVLPQGPPPIIAAPPQTAGRLWLGAAFLSGFCLLSLEIVWFRFLLLFVIGHSMAFALMLGIVLTGIALGGLAGSSWLRFSSNAFRFASPVAFSAGVLCVISYSAFRLVIAGFTTYGIIKTVDILEVGIPLMLPVSFMSGIFFILAGAALRGNLASETETAGALTLANTAGAAFGAVVGGFVLLPVLGMERSFFFIAVLYGGLGALLFLAGRARSRIAYAAGAVFFLSITLFPFGSMEKDFLQIPIKRYPGIAASGRIAAVREGLTETIIYFETLMLERPQFYTMLTNAISMSGTDYESRRYMKLFVYWPMAVHPDLKRALLIAYGVGNTAKAMTDSKSLETIDVVDISRDILEMNRIVYPDKADSPQYDPRVRVHIEDGRYFLQTTDQRFDLITGEPPPPGIAGVVNLYTREYFQLLHDRLAEGGIVTYWLPLHSLTDVSAKAILRAFCGVFEDCSLWNGTGSNLIMIGTRHASGPVTDDQFIRQWNDPAVSAEMKRLALEQPGQLGALFIGDADYLKGLVGNSRPLIDDDPKLIEAHVSSKDNVKPFFESLTNVDAARERFRNSALIKSLWPERLVTASLPYFEFQDMINANLYHNPSKLSRGMEDIHRLLTQTSLSSPVLWRLGSDPDVQQVIASAGPGEVENPVVQLHLGIRLISERNYAAAVQPLNRARQLPQIRNRAFGLLVYALCMSGRTIEAQSLVRSAQVTTGNGAPGDPPPFWIWMKNTFGIDVIVDDRPS